MEKDAIIPIMHAPVRRADDAGGVSRRQEKHWFVAIVTNRSEKKYAEILRNADFEVFVPIQREEHVWRNGSVRMIDRVLIAAVVFVRCTENERIDMLKRGFAKRFMTDRTKSARNGKHPVAIIPDDQIESFRAFVEQADAPIEMMPVPYRIGEPVKVMGGRFRGLTGNVVRYAEGKAHLVICLGGLGCAKLSIESSLVSRI